MGILGKKKMSGIMSHETGLPYRDVAAYGIYRNQGNGEELKIGAYELIYIAGRNSATIYEPDFTEEHPKYSTREIELKEG